MEMWISSRRGSGGDTKEQASMKEKASNHDPGIGHLWSWNAISVWI